MKTIVEDKLIETKDNCKICSGRGMVMTAQPPYTKGKPGKPSRCPCMKVFAEPKKEGGK